jgi:quercetin dioxygenase-like cupin family protein
MSSATLLDAVRRAADEPSEGFARRRKGMPVETAQAIVDVVIDEVLRVEDTSSPFIEHQARPAVPILESEDGLCRLAIIGPLNLVESIQWYDFRAQPKGVLESDPHPVGTIEHLYVIAGTLDVTVGEETRSVKAGEALRYRGDRAHKIVNTGAETAHATMVLVVKGGAGV